MRKPETCVIWRAVSSDDQVSRNGDLKVSLDNQLTLGREAAQRHELNVVAEITVPGESRYITLLEDARATVDGYMAMNGAERACKPYQALFDLIRAKPRVFDVLICLNTSRLGRTAPLSMAIFGICRDAGIILYELQSPPATLDMDRVGGYNDMLLSAINGVRDQQEVIKLIHNHDIGMMRRIENGHFPGVIPYGWEKKFDERGRFFIEINENEANVVRYVFDRYLNFGDGIKTIAKQLNALLDEERRNRIDDRPLVYAPPSIDRWITRTLHRFVSAAWTYAGYVHVNQESPVGRKFIRAKSRWPAIITEEIAVAALAEKKRREGARRSVEKPHLFSCCAWCATCLKQIAAEHGLDESLSYRAMAQILGDDLLISRRVRMRANFALGATQSHPYPTERYVCDNGHQRRQITTRRIKKAIGKFILASRDKTRNNQIELPDMPREADENALNTSIVIQKSKIEQLKTSISIADDDYYIQHTIDRERHAKIVSRINEQIATCESEIVNLHRRLSDIEHGKKRAERLYNFLEKGMKKLDSDDNIFFRKHIRLWVQKNHVSEIEII